MGSIIKKKIKNRNYYYYVESKRINGKPKLVNQKYLGTADKLLSTVLSAKSSLQERVLYSDVSEFGAVTLLYDIASRLEITNIIDRIVPKRKQGASIGSYILTAAINRATAPSSTNGLKQWYSSTILPSLTGLKPQVFSPQNFWNNTCITEEEINCIEDAVLSRMISDYDIDTSHIIYDASNFFTYMDTMQQSELAKRGHSKEKRNDLRIVGLALMVSPDFSIPLLHETYPGNRHDSKEFAVMMEQLKSRYESITGKKTDITVVFDRGNNSEDNIDLLESGAIKVHYVGGLKKNQAKELFDVPRSEYVPLDVPKLQGQSAYRTQTEIYGRTMTVLAVHNPELEKGQLQGILSNRAKTIEKLLELQQRLMKCASGEIKRGKKPTKESVIKAVEAILKTEYMKDLFCHEVLENNGNIYLTFASSDEALEHLKWEQLGKTVLFTDRDDFTNEEIVNAYRSAWRVEAAFRQIKDTEHLTVKPIFHWTDEKIRVHIFTCILALRLCSLLQKELADLGIYISINKMLNEMAGIKRVTTFFGDLNKPEKVDSFTTGDKLAQQIEESYRLKEKYS
jgi:transposase